MTSPIAPEKKGLGLLAWILIGCLGLGGIAFAGALFIANKVSEFGKNPAKAIAELAVKSDPDLEVIDSDDSAGTLTIRNKDTGEVATFDWSGIREGKLRFESAEGEATIDTKAIDQEGAIMTITDDQGRQTTIAAGGDQDAPEWVPVYPNAVSREYVFSTTSGDERMGSFVFETNDNVEKVVAYFEQALEDQEFEHQKVEFSSDGERSVNFGGESGGRALTVSVLDGEDLVSVSVTFQESPKDD